MMTKARCGGEDAVPELASGQGTLRKVGPDQ
jgi:hypothetical protein